ncbi:hypothetical protein HK405_000733, partial [Cladochytrium tenue]
EVEAELSPSDAAVTVAAITSMCTELLVAPVIAVAGGAAAVHSTAGEAGGPVADALLADQVLAFVAHLLEGLLPFVKDPPACLAVLVPTLLGLDAGSGDAADALATAFASLPSSATAAAAAAAGGLLAAAVRAPAAAPPARLATLAAMHRLAVGAPGSPPPSWPTPSGVDAYFAFCVVAASHRDPDPEVRAQAIALVEAWLCAASSDDGRGLLPAVVTFAMGSADGPVAFEAALAHVPTITLGEGAEWRVVWARGLFHRDEG